MIRRNFIEKLYAAALAMALLLTMAGCSEEERPAVDPHDQQTFEDDLGNARFEVVDEFDPTGTRATISGYAMSWENVTGNAATKDAIGVYGVNSNGVVRYANVKVEYRDGAWKAASSIVASGTMTYYAYYPYQSSLSGGPAAGANVGLGLQADKFFATAITNWVPKNDQSTLANFNASDLCVSRAYCDGSGKVTFTLLHQMGLAVLNLQTKTVTLTTNTVTTYTASEDANIHWSDTETTTNNSYTLPPSTTWGTSSFTNIVTNTTSTVTNKPLLISSGDRRYYFIAKPGQNYILKGTSGGTTDYEKGAWNQQLTGSSGRYYAYAPAITDGNKTRTINVDGGLRSRYENYFVGGILLANGECVAPTTYTYNSSKKPLGIIMYKRKNNADQVLSSGYGLLCMALRDLYFEPNSFQYHYLGNGSWSQWYGSYDGYWDTDLAYDMMSGEYEDATDEYDSVFPNCANISQAITDYKGYEKTRYCWDSYRPAMGLIMDDFEDQMYEWGTVASWTTTSFNQSSYFLASAGQWYQALKEFGATTYGGNYTVSVSESNNRIVNGKLVLNKLNTYLTSINSQCGISNGRYYTSTERNEVDVWQISTWSNDNYINMMSIAKMGLDYECRVRPFFMM